MLLSFYDFVKYWIYLRISKKEFYEKITSLYITSIDHCRNLYNDANNYNEHGDFNSALSSFFNASRQIEKVKNLPIIIDYQEEAISLWADIKKSIYSQLNSLVLSTKNDNLIFLNYNVNSNSIETQVDYIIKERKYPAKNIPVKYSIENKQGFFKYTIQLTNENGFVMNNLKDKMLSLKDFVINCSVDFQSYLYNFFDFEMYNDLNVNDFICFDNINVKLHNPKIYYSSSTHNNVLSKISDNSIAEIKNYLKSKNFEASENPSNSDFKIDVYVTESKNRTNNNIISISLNYSVTLTKSKSGDSNVFNYSFKGVAKSNQSARAIAYNDFLDNKLSSVFPEILSFILN